MNVMKKRFGWVQVAGAFLCGSLFFSGLAMARQSSISVSFEDLRFVVQGEDRSSADGQFDNNGVKVPESLLYNGTTYVPVRMVANLLDQPVHWDGTTKSVWIGQVDVPLVNAEGTVIGNAKLTQQDSGVQVALTASNLTPGKHGFHLHEKAFTNNDFKTAGGHFNPAGNQHGHDNPKGHHAGDFPNLTVAADGTVSTTFVIEGITLEKGQENSVWAKSFIIHAAEDDYKTDPSGNSGDRIAGGNIG